jgi:pimeloyl-ACP methyl ester carboxylesterase
MLLRRRGPLALLLAAAACEPSVPKVAPPTEVDIAVFDPQNSKLPTPNDLILQLSVDQPPLSALPAAQRDLLREFQNAGGFPNDQEVPISIDFAANTAGSTGILVQGAPDLDLSTLSSGNVLVLGINGTTGDATRATLDPTVAADYFKGADHGSLTLHHQGHTRWTAGAEYVVAIRGGPNGVKLKGGNPVYPDQTMYLLLQDKDLSLPENETLLETKFPTLPRESAAAAGAQLEQIRKGYLLPFQIIDGYFPHQELALIMTFKIAPSLSAHVETDPNVAFPLPSNFLLDPATGGKTVANIPAFGALAPGLATLDGFSTTAMMLAQTSGPIDANSVTNGFGGGKASTAVYDLTDPAHPALVGSDTYEAEPGAISQTAGGTACPLPPVSGVKCLSTAIGLQPASPAVSHGAAAFNTKPLKEATNYAVVITDRVVDINGQPLSRSTVGKILLFNDPLVTSAGASNLTGVDNATAGGLEVMRQQLLPVVAKVQTDLGITKSDIAMAYTFRTQSITGVGNLTDSTKPQGALQLGALPYAQLGGQSFPGVPVCADGTGSCAPALLNVLTAHDAFVKYGIDLTLSIPTNHIGQVIETFIDTYYILDQKTGAFLSNPAACGVNCIRPVPTLIAVPKPGSVKTACPTSGLTAAFGAQGLNCAPLVVFRHGINGGRSQMLLIADLLAAQGFVVAAIDAPLHGDRSYCQKSSECAGGTCTPIGPAGTQGDAVPPGVCTPTGGGYTYGATLCPNIATCGSQGFDPTKGGIANASGNYLISANLFRARDALRQDIIDQSMLVRVLAPFVVDNTHALQLDTIAQGFVVDPSQIYMVAESLGAVNAVADIAASPRISKVVLSSGGGTLLDTFLNSPRYGPQLVALAAGLGIAPGSAAFLQFINVAKWVIDPADPINFAKNMIAQPLPNLLANGAPQAAKAIIGQRAQCDLSVPDPFNLELYTNIGLGPLSVSQSTSTVFTTDPSAVSPTACPLGITDHGFLLDWGVNSVGTPRSMTQQAQSQMAAFLSSGTLPPPVQTP